MYRPLRVLTQDELNAVSGGDGPPTVASLHLTIDNYDPDHPSQGTSAATSAQIAMVNDTLAYLAQSPTMAAALQNFDGHTIHLVPDSVQDGGNGAATNGSVLWSPTSGVLIGDNIQSAAMALGHEIGHETQNGGMNTTANTDDPNFAPTINEVVATQFENQVASELGEPTRDTYYSWDNLTRQDDPTTHGDFLTAFYNGDSVLDPVSTQPGATDNSYLNEMMWAFPEAFGAPSVGNTTSDAAFWQDFDSYYGTNIGYSYFDDYYMTDYGYYWENNGFYDTGMGTWYDYNSNTYYYANYNSWVDQSTYMYLMYGWGGC